MKTLEFPDLLRLIDERSTAFRAAVASAPSLDVQVPTCPEWTLFDLVQHLGEVHRSWAATIAAGPDAPAKSASKDARPRLGNARPCWPGRAHRRRSYWTHCGRPARIAVAGRGGVIRSRRRPAVLSPGTSYRKSWCTPMTPSSP